MRAKLVRFSPGARTDWHSHALAQTLHIVSGIALNGTRDGTVFEVHPGERPWPHPPTSGETEAPPARTTGFTTPPTRTEGAFDR